MKEMITPKDLLYLEDMMNYNYNAYKKIDLYTSCIDNEEVEELFNKAKKMHKKHFSLLLNILK